MACERVVALVDMDCFYVQVEQRLNPSLLGKPCAVVQYNQWKGGGIIAVSYEARKFGVTRQMRGDEAKKKCPEIFLPQVPELRGKANLTRYREASAEVMDVLQNFADLCERASVDEAYLDMTARVQKELENTTLEELVDKSMKYSHIIGYTDQPMTDSHDIRGQWLAALSNESIKPLAMGAIIIQQARDAVKEKTGFTCSAGISHNKVLAKIAGGSHKPNQQTILPLHSVSKFFESIPIRKVRFFGGKFGQSVINLLKVEYMSELTRYSLEELQQYFGEKSGLWLYDVCRGREFEVVRPRQLSKSFGCGKNFTGKSKLISKEKVRYWILQLASELSERLKIEEEKNNRTAKLISVGLTTETDVSGVRSFPLRYSDSESMCENAMQVLKTFNSGTADKWQPGVTSLYMQATKFEEISTASSSIASFFSKKDNDDKKDAEDTVKSPSTGTEENYETASNPCLITASYARNEIDRTIIHELPDDIRNEIEQFLGISKTLERPKRTSSGIEKYTVTRNDERTPTDKSKLTRQASTDIPGNTENTRDNGKPRITGNTRNTGSTSFTENAHFPGNGSIAATISDSTLNSAGFTRCPKCGQQVTNSKIEEHNDFHFALEVQKHGEVTQTAEPPRKRQKGTISKFFVPKGK